MQRPRRWLEAASRKLKLSSLSIAVGIVDAGADQDPAAEEEEKTKEVMHFVPLCSSSSEENSYKIREKAFADPCRYVGSAMGPNKSVGSEASLESSGRSRSARKQSARAKEDAEEHCADGDSQRSHEMAIKWRDTKELDDELFQRYYEFVHVGNGRFSKVYCVKRRDGTSTSWRALKKIFHSSATDDHTIMKTFREIELLEQLDHPNIVKYMDHFKANNEVYIELEWAGSGDLKNQLLEFQNRGALPSETTVWYYFGQIAAAVAYLHAQNIVHRDLKPANILISSNKTIKVGDFGLSRSFRDDSYLQSFVGTPLYMAPEVLSSVDSDDEGYNAKCDIWSLGCILYELATLRNPFFDHSVVENLSMLIARIKNCIYDPLEPPCSDTLCKLSSSLLLTDPEHRPDASAVLADAEKGVKQFKATERAGEIHVSDHPHMKAGFWGDDGQISTDSGLASDVESECEEVVKSPVLVHHRKDSLEDVCRSLLALMNAKIAKSQMLDAPLAAARDQLRPGKDATMRLKEFAQWLSKAIREKSCLSPDSIAGLIVEIARLPAGQDALAANVYIEVLGALVQVIQDDSAARKAANTYSGCILDLIVETRHPVLLEWSLQNLREARTDKLIMICGKSIFKVATLLDTNSLKEHLGTFKKAILHGGREMSYPLYLFISIALLHVLVKREVAAIEELIPYMYCAEKKLKERIADLFKIQVNSRDGVRPLLKRFGVQNFEFYMQRPIHGPSVAVDLDRIKPMKRASSMPHVFFNFASASSDSMEQGIKQVASTASPKVEEPEPQSEQLPDMSSLQHKIRRGTMESADLSMDSFCSASNLNSFQANFPSEQPQGPRQEAALVQQRSGASAQNSGGLNYILGKEIGSGSFGRVYLAVNKDTGVFFAVKQISVQSHVEETIAKEVRSYSTLKHKHLVGYLGTESRPEEGVFNIFLEFCNWGSIAQMLTQFGSFPRPLIRLYTRHIVSALKYLHDHGVVHRDVKGANVLVLTDGLSGSMAKLTDFGCSFKAEERDDISKLSGTISWMSPEAARQDKNLGFKSDVWSLGATIIEMVTTAPPWPEFNNNPYGLLYKIANTKVPPAFPEELLPKTDIYDFLTKCLAPAISERASSAELCSHPFLMEDPSQAEQELRSASTAYHDLHQRGGVNMSRLPRAQRNTERDLPEYRPKAQVTPGLTRTSSAAQIFKESVPKPAAAPTKARYYRRKTNLVLPQYPRPRSSLRRQFSNPGISMHGIREDQPQPQPQRRLRAAAGAGPLKIILTNSYIKTILGFLFEGETSPDAWMEACTSDVKMHLPYLQTPYLLPTACGAKAKGIVKGRCTLDNVEAIVASQEESKLHNNLTKHFPGGYSASYKLNDKLSFRDEKEVTWFWDLEIKPREAGRGGSVSKVFTTVGKGMLRFAATDKLCVFPKVFEFELDWDVQAFLNEMDLK